MRWPAAVRTRLAVMSLALLAGAVPSQGADSGKAPIVLEKMGSVYFDGEVITGSNGDTFHGDHGYAQYYIPQNARELPLVMWHGLGQSGKTWESTPDGREGYWQIFTRRGWPVYIIDQPRRGRAGRTAHLAPPPPIPTLESEAEAWNTFRLGLWIPPGPPTFYAGVQVPQTQKWIDQFMRQQTPNTGDEAFPSAETRSRLGGAVAEIFQQIGPGILITHSHSGQYGWVTAIKTDLVKAVVAYEPGEFAFPEDEVPSHVRTGCPQDLAFLDDFMAPQLVSRAEFLRLTKIPIQVIFGDNISDSPSCVFGVELWRMVRERAKQFVEAVNRNGGDAQYLELPQIGVLGNTHFPFSDLNNRQIADLLSAFLASKRLDRRGRPH